MAGIQKHNKKTWSDYQRYSDHVYDEKFLLEIYHNVKEDELQFPCMDNSPLEVSNAGIGYWKAEMNYVSRDGNDYYLKADFTVPMTGDYNIEIVYRNSEERPFPCKINLDGSEVEEFLRGSPEFRSRIINRRHMQNGEHTLKVTANANIYIMAIVVKHIEVYRADDTLKRENRLTLIKANHKVTKMVGADELSIEILYDNAWQDPNSLTNFLFDYRDEVNFSLINNDGVMEQVFGGYVSSCSLGNNETTLTINCAGRMIDGEKRYIVEEMNIGGTASVLEDSYPKEYIRHFDNYNDATVYLFDNYECALRSNMYDIVNAKQYDNIEFDFMIKENYDKIIGHDISKELMPMGVYIRNNGGKSTQRLYLYEKEWYNLNEPILLDDFPIFYITYGMGEAVTTMEVEQTTTDDTSESVSTGGVINVNMMPSCGCCGGTVAYKRYQKSWRNYCPACGKSGTLTDNPKGVYEGEITCSMAKGGCDADYCGYCGGDKWGNGRCTWRKLTPASASENGNAQDTTGGASKSTTNVIDTIYQEASKFNYGEGVSDLQQMRRLGYGDDKAFSTLIYSELVDMGVGARLVQYQNRGKNDFRSVLVKNTEGNYVDFPYGNNNFKRSFGENLMPNGSSRNGTVVYSHDGLGVNVESGIIEGEGAITNGFDKDKPFKCYIVLEYSTTPNGSRRFAFLDFTAQKPDNYETWSGLTPLFLNNIINTSSVNVIDKMRTQWQVDHVYLHKLFFEYVVEEEELYATSEEGTTDNSSYRMILRNCGFRNGTVLNPIDLGSTGKTVNSVVDTVLESGELKLRRYPKTHRDEDVVIISKDKSFTPRFTIDESKNILAISNWTFNPVSDFVTRQLVVYKNKMEDNNKGAVYNYTETRSQPNLLRYGELNKLTSLSDDISGQEAYYNARKEYRSVVGDSMTVTIYGCPSDVQLGDYVECLFEESNYNDVKEIMSVEHEYDIKQAPHIQTKFGLNRPNPLLALQNKFEEERKTAQEHKALFGRTAIYDDDVYTWEE